MDDTPPAVWALCELAAVSYAISSARLGYTLMVSPLYGSTATKQYLDHVVAAGCAIAGIVSVAPQRFLLSLFASMLFVTPIVAYHTARYTARWHDLWKGPLLVHLLAFYPLVVVAISSARLWRGNVVKDSIISRIGYGFVVFLASLGFDKLALLVPGGVVTPTSIFFSLGVFCMAAVYISPPPVLNSVSKNKKKKLLAKPPAPSRSLVPFLIPSAVCFLASLVYPNRPLQPLPYTDPSGKVKVLASIPSTTGRIVVGDNLELGFRYLRADHSLLGGMWLDLPQRKGQIDDSIYVAFALQEAVRLIERPPTPGKRQDNALIIGLGIGVSASSLMYFGTNVTVIEIDPAVYDYARKYFKLPEPNAVHLTDARGWVHEQSVLSTPVHQYDIVVHDCFSGGSVPAHIYTQEFWEDLKKLVAPNGIVAVNYAGYVGSNPSRAILATLLSSFAQCRAFNDKVQSDGAYDDTEFLNMVFFCTNAQQPLTFREAIPSDTFKSKIREMMYKGWSKLEVPLAHIASGKNTSVEQWKKEELDGWVLTDKTNPLAGWQHQSALDHWKLMRTIMDNVYWETF